MKKAGAMPAFLFPDYPRSQMFGKLMLFHDTLGATFGSPP
jgi:hypothetical protein